MITAYCYEHRQVNAISLNVNEPLPETAIWLDIYQPIEAERLWLSSFSSDVVPDKEDRNEIEASSRFYQNRDGLHVNSLFSQKSGQSLSSVNIYFNLRERLLITMRDDDERLIDSSLSQLQESSTLQVTPLQLFIKLFKAKVDHLADLIEEIYSTLENVGHEIFEKEHIDEVFRLITNREDTNGKIRLNLLDTQRALNYILRDNEIKLTDDETKDINNMLSDIASLIPHTQFIFEKINFLMDAAMGFTGLQQNKISKIFSVTAIVFLPPTLIASTYGMNFENIPEVHWHYGYPWSIALMFASAAATFWFFKIKRWL
ncbi:MULTISPECIES: magnesium/cobalt transporter CorA [unclassified Shewanella]|uniref:magnesium/cobalt transporter CorA n=1 Tax=unclassified Shewanella TaxID=196818 RepID=UPI001BBEA646|nr:MULTISPECIES: magnesium/cobalt transporter CorA [unclassified Shewanella]GIU17261.1 magnesium transport protein CorA [Shewanella sp. MBTL60-112-B1]GIU40234.1 magnesium transport protein CorA [Shewanella sp. MBTL60-112-B2]